MNVQVQATAKSRVILLGFGEIPYPPCRIAVKLSLLLHICAKGGSINRTFECDHFFSLMRIYPSSLLFVVVFTLIRCYLSSPFFRRLLRFNMNLSFFFVPRCLLHFNKKLSFLFVLRRCLLDPSSVSLFFLAAILFVRRDLLRVHTNCFRFSQYSSFR